LDSPGPVLYKQVRVAHNRRKFFCYKFRTMIAGAEILKQQLEAENEADGPVFKIKDDPRVTAVGRYLRKSGLDELPQLYNIMRGEMSFIGPRPEREAFIREFQQLIPLFREGRRANDPSGSQVIYGYRERIPYYSYRLMVKPGITGWAQVMHSYSATLEETKEKLEFDLYYIKNMSWVLDLAILLKTIRIVLFGWGR